MTKQQFLKDKNYIYNKEENICKKTFAFGNEDNIEYLVIGVIDLVYNIFYCYPDSVESQEDIDNLQLAFNNLKQDFEECMKYD